MKVVNKKARFNYQFLEKLEAGIVLTGSEVKSVRQGRIRLDDSFVRIDPKGEVWLINSHIHPYIFADNRSYDPARSRKLLLHKKEILTLAKKMEGKNLTLIPTACYSRKRSIKLELALARGRKKWEKKEKIKKRDIEREMRRELKRLK